MQAFNEGDGDDDGIDEAAEMTAAERNKLLEDTSIIHEAFRKLRHIAQAIVNSPTILLPAWKGHCRAANLKLLIPPRDVAT